MEVKVKIEKTLHTDNDKVFYEDEDIAFEMEKTGDKYIGRIKKIKKKSIIIDDIMINPDCSAQINLAGSQKRTG